MSASDDEAFTTWVSELAGSDVLVVFLCGELDVSTVPRFVATMQEVIRTPRHVIVDVHLLSYIDSTGVAAMISARRALEAEGRRLCLVGCHGLMARVLRITRLDSELPAFEDVEGALAGMMEEA